MVQRGMVGKPVEDISSELLSASFHGAAGRDAVSAIRARSKYANQRHNLPKISFKSVSEGSLDAASEGELCEGGRCESTLTGVSVSATRDLISTGSSQTHTTAAPSV
jgi:hypothetical protein